MSAALSVTTMEPADTVDESRGERFPVLTVISHPDLTRIGDCAFLTHLHQSRALEISRAVTDFAPPGKVIGKPLGDSYLSRKPFLLRLGGHGEIRLEKKQCASYIGADGLEVIETTTFPAESLERGVVLNLAKRIVLLLHMAAQRRTLPLDHGLVGNSDCIHDLRHEIEKVADLKTPILLRGPSGSGKELVARAVHRAGGRNRPFIAVNMGAIPQHLAASELFGALKGSFTGADRHQLGFFRAAAGGTLFLDEIGEASLEVQVALLRALESGEITPVGAQKPVPVKTRLIAATDADLETKMEEDSFKAPLFHRLAGYEITVPSLRQRREDLGRLLMHFARGEFANLGSRLPSVAEGKPWLPAKLVEALLFFAWPGNVRQLANVVRQLVIGCRGEPVLRLVPKVASILADPPEPDGEATSDEVKQRKPSQIPREELRQALRDNAWGLKATALQLGISRGALYQIIDRTPGLQKAKDLGAEEIRAVLRESKGDVEVAAERFQVSLRALRRRITDLGIDPLGGEEVHG